MKNNNKVQKIKEAVLTSASFEDMVKREENAYCIKVGNDYVEIDGQIRFSLIEAKDIYKDLMLSMENQYKNSKNEVEKEQIREIIETMAVVPYRIH